VHLRQLSRLAEKHLNIQVIESTLEDLSPRDVSPGEFDTVICLNVLEHIEDDEDAVRKMIGLLRRGGRLLLYVPACQWAFGAMDSAMGHHRRYGRRSLRTLAARAGASVVATRCVNILGLAGWFWAGVVLKETHIDVRKARFMDRLVPFISAMERLVKPPLGQSIFAVLEPDG
jgi:2-polyprenyl-3-methyl-5-hydroxy-6-metoxy-1,4-benzoquinol methylase